MYEYWMPLYGTVAIGLVCDGAMFTNSFIVWNKSHIFRFVCCCVFELHSTWTRKSNRADGNERDKKRNRLKLNLYRIWIMDVIPTKSCVIFYSIHLFRYYCAERITWRHAEIISCMILPSKLGNIASFFNPENCLMLPCKRWLHHAAFQSNRLNFLIWTDSRRRVYFSYLIINIFKNGWVWMSQNEWLRTSFWMGFIFFFQAVIHKKTCC